MLPAQVSILNKELGRTVSLIRSNMIRAGQSTTGLTQSLLDYTVTGNFGYILAAKWMRTLEEGRGPANQWGDKQEFIADLALWIRYKGFTYESDEDLLRLANFFRWYMNKFGNTLFRAGGRKDIYTPPIDDLLIRLVELLPEPFIQTAINSFKKVYGR